MHTNKKKLLLKNNTTVLKLDFSTDNFWGLFLCFCILVCLFVFCFIICFVLISAVYEHTLLNHYITMLENTKVTIKNWLWRETGNIWYTRLRKTKQKHNTICVGPQYTQTNTNNINKTWALLQTTGGKDEPNIVFMWKS